MILRCRRPGESRHLLRRLLLRDSARLRLRSKALLLQGVRLLLLLLSFRGHDASQMLARVISAVCSCARVLACTYVRFRCACDARSNARATEAALVRQTCDTRPGGSDMVRNRMGAHHVLCEHFVCCER